MKQLVRFRRREVNLYVNVRVDAFSVNTRIPFKVFQSCVTTHCYNIEQSSFRYVNEALWYFLRELHK